MHSNEILQYEIHRAIKQGNAVDPNQIGVTVKNRIVTLSGTLGSYEEKHKVENTVKAIKGVSALVDEIIVDYKHSVPLDSELIRELVINIEQKCPYVQNLNIVLEHEELIINGEVDFSFQKEGVTAIIASQTKFKFKNEIEVRCERTKPTSTVLLRALKANSSLDESHIQVAADNHNVTLSGYVSTLFEKELAAHIAQRTPGVASVHNDLKIIHEVPGSITI